MRDPKRARVFFKRSEVLAWARKRDGGRKSEASLNLVSTSPVGERFMTMERDVATLKRRVSKLEAGA